MERLGLNNQRVRAINNKLFLTLLWQHKTLSKSRLAQLTGLSIPAVSNILDQLLKEGRISHQANEDTGRGVSAGNYQLPESGDWVLCLNVTPYRIESQLADSRMMAVGEYHQQAIRATTPESLLTAISQCWREHTRRWPGQCINLALGIHGQVDPQTGVSQTMPQAPWTRPVEFKYLLEAQLNIRVLLDNDCVMLALAEKWQSPARRDNFCVINVDYGIGSSMVIDRQIWRGSLYGSGQIGHTIVNPDGSHCACGRYGCLETVASLQALKRQTRIGLKTQPGPQSLDPEQVTTAQLIALWQQGDESISRWAESAARAIGLSLYNFLNTLNINQIIFYGRSCAFGDNWLAVIKQQVGFNPFDHSDSPAQATDICFGQLTRPQQLLGIGWLYVEEALQA